LSLFRTLGTGSGRQRGTQEHCRHGTVVPPSPHFSSCNLTPHSFLDMLTEVSELSHGQPVAYRSLGDGESEAESLNGCDDEVGKASLVVSPARIPAYDRCPRKANGSTESGDNNVSVERDKVLIEWFAGWAATNVQRHRKFPAISGVAPFLSDVSDRWGHVRCFDSIQPGKFLLTICRLRS
jgi:hypothetical protein